MWKTISIKPNSAIALTKKQWYRITSSKAGDRFPCCHGGFHLAKELLVVTGRTEIPVMIVHVMVADKDISYFEKKDLLKKVVKDKLKMQASSYSERTFRIYFMSAGLHELGIRDEEELIEKFPNLRQYIILLNDTTDTIELDIPKETLSSKMFSLN